jgi:hypothetical protein
METCILIDAAKNSGEWEDRLLAILDIISSAEVKGQLVLECMRRTSIPWSDALDSKMKTVHVLMQTLAIPSLRLHQELVDQLKLLELKKMILRYGVVNFNVSDLDMAKST